MFNKIIISFSKIAFLADFILNLEDDEFYTVLRQLDATNIFMEFNQWRDINE